MSKKSLKQLYPEIMFENIFVTEGGWAKWLDAGDLACKELLSYLPAYKNQPGVLKKIKEKFQGLKDTLLELVKPMDNTRNVICHGDPWIGNILFTYKNNIPQQVSINIKQFKKIPRNHSEIILILTCMIMKS